MAREHLFSQQYNIENTTVQFHFYREGQDGQVTMTLTYQFPGMGEVPCKRIFFPVEAESYQSPYLSWYNLICCSNNYGPIPVIEYMNYAVQNGKKVAATVYPVDATEYMGMISELGQDYYVVPYHTREYEYMLFVGNKGTLADYYDYDAIKAVYDRCGVQLDWDKIAEYFKQELVYFCNEDVCDVEIHSGERPEDFVVTGLLFGYPLASTIALIQKTMDLCEG